VKADKDKSGSIDWKEFCIIAADRESLTSKGSLKEAFTLFDKDKSGSIDANELAAVIRAFTDAIPNEGSNEEKKMISEIMETVDVNKDGVIDFDEFCAMMEKISTAEPEPAATTEAEAEKKE
jgi:Ca2+-binding EF-hand superfamily protein